MYPRAGALTQTSIMTKEKSIGLSTPSAGSIAFWPFWLPALLCRVCQHANLFDFTRAKSRDSHLQADLSSGILIRVLSHHAKITGRPIIPLAGEFTNDM